MKIISIILCICWSIAFSASPYAKHATLILGAEDSWPPYSDKRGQGISTNIVKAALAKVGLESQIVVRPYSRVLQDVKAGALDAGYNITRQKNTEQEFVFGNEPILRASTYWYFRWDTTPPATTTQSLPDGYKVGVIIDYEYGDIFEEERHRFKEVRVPRQVQLIKMLKQGRIDAILMFEEEANQTLKEMGLSKTAIQKAMLNHTGDVYLAFSRKKPHSQELAQKFDQGIKKLKETGEYQQLLNADTLQ
jgi:polar amino acid transport system substrate-binding protein